MTNNEKLDEIKRRWKESPSTCLLNIVCNIFDFVLGIAMLYTIFCLTKSIICAILACICFEMIFGSFLISKSKHGIFSSTDELAAIADEYSTIHRIIMCVICIGLSWLI